jgi:hypothetical protein
MRETLKCSAFLILGLAGCGPIPSKDLHARSVASDDVLPGYKPEECHYVALAKDPEQRFRAPTFENFSSRGEGRNSLEVRCKHPTRDHCLDYGGHEVPLERCHKQPTSDTNGDTSSMAPQDLCESHDGLLMRCLETMTFAVRASWSSGA